MGFKLEKDLNILFGIFKDHKKEDIILYYNIKSKEYSKNKFNENYALNDTIMKFSNLAIRKSIDALSELQINEKSQSPINYYAKKCQKYIKIDKEDDVFAHALVDTYKKFIKYGEK